MSQTLDTRTPPAGADAIALPASEGDTAPAAGIVGRPLHRLLRPAAAWSFVGLLLLIAIGLGWRARIWTWHFTEHVHYAPDMHNAYKWGGRALDEGYIDLYDRVMREPTGEPYDGLDYVPLRLWIMHRWVGWTRTAFPEAQRWRPDYAFNAPLLRLNTVMELAAAGAAFAIVFIWVRRADRAAARRSGAMPSSLRRAYRWWGLPVAAFLLVWFNPAMIISAHGRPTWDVWIVPFYLGAVLCAMLNAWFIAGVLVGIGAMLKGQQFIVAPLFVIWPIVLWRWGAAIRAIIGCALAVGLVVAPWMLTYLPGEAGAARAWDGQALAWLATAVLAVIAVTGLRWWVPWLRRRWRLTAAVIAAAVVLIPAILARGDAWPVLAAGAIALAAALALLPMRMQAHTLAGVIGLGLLSCMFLFRGSDAWFEIAFRYGGMIKYPQLEVGGASSLAGILQNRYGWRHADVAFTWEPGEWLGRWPEEVMVVTIHDLLLWSFAGLLALSCIGLAVQYRLRSERFLAAVATPWVLFFAVAPLMHERYLLWGAAAAAVAVGAGWGPALLGVFLSIVSWIMSAGQMLGDGRRLGTESWPTLGQDLMGWIGPTHPGIGWAVLLAAGAFLYLTFAPARPPAGK